MRLAARMGLFVGTFLAVAVCGWGQTPSAAQTQWMGTRVVTKYKTPIRLDNRVVADGVVFRVYTVSKVEGGQLHLVSGSVGGWIAAADVVPLDQAVAFYTEEIRIGPSHPGAYGNRGLIRFENKEYAAAIADFTEAVQRNPTNANAFACRGAAWKHEKNGRQALADFDEAIRLDPKSLTAYNNSAWIRATCSDPALRNGKQARDRAITACDLSDWKAADHLGTLAAAYAECGAFKQAVEWQNKANVLYLDEEARQRGGERLKLYQECKPYREPK